MEKLDNILFYSIDRAIRTYRQYAQQRLKEEGYTITIDQWLIIKCILENPKVTQNEISEKVFKDSASVTRIITLLVKAKYLKRKINKTDRRRSVLQVTELGEQIISSVDQIVKVNRSVALNGIDDKEMEISQRVMDQITTNCKKIN